MKTSLRTLALAALLASGAAQAGKLPPLNTSQISGAAVVSGDLAAAIISALADVPLYSRIRNMAGHTEDPVSGLVTSPPIDVDGTSIVVVVDPMDNIIEIRNAN